MVRMMEVESFERYTISTNAVVSVMTKLRTLPILDVSLTALSYSLRSRKKGTVLTVRCDDSSKALSLALDSHILSVSLLLPCHFSRA